MPQERIQLNLRLDGQRDFSSAIKTAAEERGISVNSFVLNAIKKDLGWEISEHTTASAIPQLDAILEAVQTRLVPVLDTMIDDKVNQRLGEALA